MKQVYTRDENPGINLLPKISVRAVIGDDLVDDLIDDAVAQLAIAVFVVSAAVFLIQGM